MVPDVVWQLSDVPTNQKVIYVYKILDCSQFKGTSKTSVFSGDRVASLWLDTPAEEKLIHCQRPIHYLLLIDAESWSLKVEVNSSLSQIFNGKQSEELELGGQEVHLMEHRLITLWLLPLGVVVWHKFDSSSLLCRWGVVEALLCSPLFDWALGTPRSYGRSRQEHKQLRRCMGLWLLSQMGLNI